MNQLCLAATEPKIKCFYSPFLLNGITGKLKMNIKVTRKNWFVCITVGAGKNAGRVKLLSQKNWYRLKCVLKNRHKRVD